MCESKEFIAIYKIAKVNGKLPPGRISHNPFTSILKRSHAILIDTIHNNIQLFLLLPYNLSQEQQINGSK